VAIAFHPAYAERIRSAESDPVRSTRRPGHDIIVIGASAGGVEALRQLVHDLPAELPAAVFIVLHLPPQSPSLLPYILARAGQLAARHATDGEEIEPGRIYIAPPDRHLLLEHGRVCVTHGPKENRMEMKAALTEERAQIVRQMLLKGAPEEADAVMRGA
jgi:chemotaxis response regulator CheB